MCYAMFEKPVDATHFQAISMGYCQSQIITVTHSSNEVLCNLLHILDSVCPPICKCLLPKLLDRFSSYFVCLCISGNSLRLHIGNFFNKNLIYIRSDNLVYTFRKDGLIYNYFYRCINIYT